MSTSLRSFSGWGRSGVFPFTFWFEREICGNGSAANFGGVLGVGNGSAAGESSGVVELVELDKPDENELMLPHVFEKLEDDDNEGPKGRAIGMNGFDLDLDLA